MKVSVRIVRSAGSCSIEATAEVDLDLNTTDEFTLDELMAALVRAANIGCEVTES